MRIMLNKIKKIWLIGPGNIGFDYLKVLQSLHQYNLPVDITVIGRSPKPDWPVEVYEHGLDSYIESTNDIPDYAIIATDESELYTVTKKLINIGISNILIEKPAALYLNEIKDLHDTSITHDCNLFIGYNRRFYQSVQECKRRIDLSPGPISITFSFTEWPHMIPFDTYTTEELHRFFLCNSSHIPDTVFYLAGQPKELNCYTSGKLEWHPSAAIFIGSGVTEHNILFNYDANWDSAGRWSIEISLPGEKLILRPIEKLHIQNKGSLEVHEYKLQNEKIDSIHKPGLYNEVKSFLTLQDNLCTIVEHFNNFKWYKDIANYK